MPEKAIISHRGEKYEIGRGKRFYGIWVVGAPYEAPVDRWPETRDGWEQAWTRFATVEVPGTIAPVRTQRSGLGTMLKSRRATAEAEADPAGGSAGGGPRPARPARPCPAWRRPRAAVAPPSSSARGCSSLAWCWAWPGCSPTYAGGQSLLSQGDQIVPHLCYVIAWAISAGPIALSVSRPRAARLGALFALGLSAVTLGLFVSDIGEVVSGGASLGTGLIVSLLGWAACTAGAAIALVASCRDTDPAKAGAGRFGRLRLAGQPARSHLGPLALLVLAGVGTAAAFAAAWDSYTVAQAALGTVKTVQEGNAFSNPGLVIAGNVAVMVAVVAVAVLAALWRPARQGALLLAGAIIPLAAQAVSALIQISQPPYSFFGLTQAQAAQDGVTISSGVTPIFWVYCVFVVSLLISCAWLLTAPGHPAVPASPWTPSPHGDGTWAPGGPAAETVADTPDTNHADAVADTPDINQAEADANAGRADTNQADADDQANAGRADNDQADEDASAGPTPGSAPVDA